VPFKVPPDVETDVAGAVTALGALAPVLVVNESTEP
jgi:hypothetical protein